MDKTIRDEDTWIYVTEDGRYAFVREYPKHLDSDFRNLENNPEFIESVKGMSPKQIKESIDEEIMEFEWSIFPTDRWTEKHWEDFKSNLEEVFHRQTDENGEWMEEEVIMADPLDIFGKERHLQEVAENICEEAYPNGEKVPYNLDSLGLYGMRRFSREEKNAVS